MFKFLHSRLVPLNYKSFSLWCPVHLKTGTVLNLPWLYRSFLLTFFLISELPVSLGQILHSQSHTSSQNHIYHILVHYNIIHVYRIVINTLSIILQIQQIVYNSELIKIQLNMVIAIRLKTNSHLKENSISFL